MRLVRTQDFSQSAKTKDTQHTVLLFSRASQASHQIVLAKKQRTDKQKQSLHDYWVFKKILNPCATYGSLLGLAHGDKKRVLNKLLKTLEDDDLNWKDYLSSNNHELLSWDELIGAAKIFHDPFMTVAITAQPSLTLLIEALKTRCPQVPTSLFDEIKSKYRKGTPWYYQRWFLSDMDKFLDIDAERSMNDGKVALAALEVYAQEYRRLVCPEHLFNGMNLFPKYRMAFSSEIIDLDNIEVYVASKKLNFIGDFKYYPDGILAFKKRIYQFNGHDYNFFNQRIYAADLPGFGTCTLLAKILGDLDLKFNNLGLVFNGLKADGKPNFHFTHLDSGCAFAGLGNIEYDAQWYMGDLTENEVVHNPDTQLEFYNYIWHKDNGGSISSRKTLHAMSQIKSVHHENMITALRCSLINPKLLSDLADTYFPAQDAIAAQSQSDIITFMVKRTDDLKKIIKYSVHFKEFFLNQDAIQSGLLRKEITLLFKSIVDFKIYSKKRLIIDNESFRKIFKEDAIDLLASLLEHLDSKNKENLFKEAYHAKCFSDDDQAEDLFCEILSTVDHDLYHATVHEKTSCESFLFACEPFIRLMFGSRSESFEKKAVSNENPLISPSEPIRVDKPHCA